MSGGSGGDDDDDKQFDPSPKKLEDARRKGEVARSADLITTGSFFGMVLVAVTVGPDSLQSVFSILSAALVHAAAHGLHSTVGGGAVLGGTVLSEIAIALAPWAIVPLVMALLSVIAQRAFTVTPSKLAPKVSRISILSNAKNKFGRSGLFEFAKSAVKLTIYCVILLWYLTLQMPHILSTIPLEPRPMVAEFLQLTVRFMMLIVLISICIGGVDFMWQRAEHIRKNRMSRKDLTDEQKQSEGDPMMKQQRRQRGYDIAMNTMLADVPEAAVVVVNPTHYAVALKWDRSAPGAPVCVAKGVDQVAARIREVAERSGVPIHPDPPTARALHASVEIGAEVRPEQYAAIAVAIRYAEDMRRKAAQQ
ncbi:flagellar biosynthesis protein FlhB [Maribius pontilimi]|uniref:Flagellar biosynthesis protein FlhB n=1 Tax=Palleronia pontilimi TaxID=1964209 RepID=A0A934IJP0_9RHOB|nr:flagellar type III secretion system protein FlhB [Palleronia pontilimi]MBJ3763184.1 flagellar biosynthesis protein FlhB [Palleronia pontilimi]